MFRNSFFYCYYENTYKLWYVDLTESRSKIYVTAY
jgi:hypothetical protein